MLCLLITLSPLNLICQVASGSDKGRELQELMVSGALVPNAEVLSLLNAAITRAKGASKGFLIDGYPREKNQGIEFEAQIAPADLAIYFDCSEETMLKRILARAAAATVKRADDNEATIRSRLQTFKRNTSDILALYEEKTLTVSRSPSDCIYIHTYIPSIYSVPLQINAERDVEDIFMEVVEAIDCVLQKKERESKIC